jgi:signal transduction histidine kinase/ActR/RegA family two-component response regulator
MFAQLFRNPSDRVAAYALGAAIAVLGLMLQLLIRPWVGAQIPFLFFLPALVFTAATLGRGPALLVLVAGAVNGLLFRTAGGDIAVHSLHDVAPPLAYAVVGSLVVLYGGYLRLTTGRAALAEQRLSLAQENTGVGVFELDFKAGTAFVSPSLAQLMGHPDMHGPIPLQRWLGALNPDHVDESHRAMRARIARGELRYEREQKILLPNGETRWLLSRVTLDAPDGELRQARGATIDITARKHVEELLQAAIMERERARSAAVENETRFAVALESCAMPFSILAPVRDDAGRIVDFRWTYLNPAAASALGRPVGELEGRRIGEVLPRAWSARGLFDHYVGVIERGEQCQFEVRSDATDNGGWFNVVAAPLQGAAAVWFANITERKLHEQALQDADRRKDEFLATLAHELRNPLAPIRQGVRIAAMSTSTEAQKRWSHGIIERQVQNMSLLLDDLLDVSRIGRGTLLLRRSAESLSAVIGTAIEMARPHVEAKRHVLQIELPEEDLALDIDPLRIAQVIGNLLTNAAKYTDAGGRIRLSARREGGGLIISIADNGIGLEKEQLSQVFEMFSQIPGAVDKSEGGLGIGLALARGLVELHGGRISASSDGPGLGTEFAIHLPDTCVIGRAQPATAVVPPISVHKSPARRILIADDNADSADSLAELLRLEGHEVHVAYDGEQALATFTHFRPDAALLDVGMPRLSGLDVVRAIRLHPHGQHATLIAITGWGQERDRRLALEAGFDHHITKPMHPEHIQALIETGRVPPVPRAV